MNINEQCLLQFLNNPGRLELTTGKLKKLIPDLKFHAEILIKQEIQEKTVIQNEKFIYS